MASPGTTRGGRRGRGRAVVTRQSKRLQGLPPEDQPDLDAVKMAARERKRAAREEEAAENVSVAESAVEEQPAAELESQGAPAASSDQGSQSSSSHVEETVVAEATPSLESSLPSSENQSGNLRAPAIASSIPSVIGTSRTSDEPSSGFQTSRGSSSEESTMSVGRGASSHMPFMGGSLAFVAQEAGAGTITAGNEMGIQVTRTTLPVKVEQEDADMTEAEPEIPSPVSDDHMIPRPLQLDLRRLAPIAQASEVSSQGANHEKHRRDVRSEKSQRSFSRRSSSVASSLLKSEATGSQRSGPAQIELNVMRQQQEWQARMEQAQMEFLAQERLASMERERHREQRHLEARRQIQTLTDRLLESEKARLDAQRRAEDLEERRSRVSEPSSDVERLRTALQTSEKTAPGIGVRGPMETTGSRG
ncbi:hypothetical protein DVH05_015258 [Phytophthora capsici]|nr:hypothetical protein DVH05_015258 [Phytophthora capsici]